MTFRRPLLSPISNKTFLVVALCGYYWLLLQLSWQSSSTLFFSHLYCEAISTRVTWINGIAHNELHMEEGQEEIAKLFGLRKIDYCHNPTSMKYDDDIRGYAGDIFQASTQLVAGRITVEVNTLVEYLKQNIRNVGRNGVVVHIAHSQGALITSLAAKQLTPDELSHIECICFGGAAVISKNDFPTLRRAINYYSVNDPLLFVVPTASKALETGVFTSRTASGEPEYVFLTPRCGNPTEDHGLLNPTYGEALAWEGKRYQMKYQNPIQRLVLQPMYQYTYHILLLIWTYIIKYNPILQPMWNIISYIIHQLSEHIIQPIIHMYQLFMKVISYHIEIHQQGENGGELLFKPIDASSTDSDGKILIEA